MKEIEIAENLFFMVEKTVAILITKCRGKNKEICLYCQQVDFKTPPKNIGHTLLRKEADKYGVKIVVGGSCMANRPDFKKNDLDRFDDEAKSVLIVHGELDLLLPFEQEALKQLRSFTHQDW